MDHDININTVAMLGVRVLCTEPAFNNPCACDATTVSTDIPYVQTGLIV
jgi:hypothetical protein